MPDESSQSKKLAEVKPTEIVQALPQDDKFNSFVDYAAKGLKCEVICKTNCKLCNSKFRIQAEEKYSKSLNMVATHRFLIDSGESVSYMSVRNHLLTHFVQPELEERLRDYAEDINSWSKIRQEKEEMYRTQITVLQRRLHLMDSSTDNFDHESQRKTADTVTKLIDQINKVQEKIDLLRKDESPIKILLLKFEQMVKEKLENMKSEEARIALVDVLEGFMQIVAEFESND